MCRAHESNFSVISTWENVYTDLRRRIRYPRRPNLRHSLLLARVSFDLLGGGGLARTIERDGLPRGQLTALWTQNCLPEVQGSLRLQGSDGAQLGIS